jgi:hypothetical protein
MAGFSYYGGIRLIEYVRVRGEEMDSGDRQIVVRNRKGLRDVQSPRYTLQEGVQRRISSPCGPDRLLWCGGSSRHCVFLEGLFSDRISDTELPPC